MRMRKLELSCQFLQPWATRTDGGCRRLIAKACFALSCVLAVLQNTGARSQIQIGAARKDVQLRAQGLPTRAETCQAERVARSDLALCSAMRSAASVSARSTDSADRPCRLCRVPWGDDTPDWDVEDRKSASLLHLLKLRAAGPDGVQRPLHSDGTSLTPSSPPTLPIDCSTLNASPRCLPRLLIGGQPRERL